MAAALAPAAGPDALVGLPLPPIPSTVLTTSPDGGATGAGAPTAASSSASSSGSAPPTDTEPLRPGELADVWRAALADPKIGPAITNLGDQAKAHVQSD